MAVHITVTLGGPLKKYRLAADTVDVPPGTTISGILSTLGIPAESVSLLVLNGSKALATEVLKDGDHITIYPPVCGG
jgi:sulfur carrier protein ThiS